MTGNTKIRLSNPHSGDATVPLPDLMLAAVQTLVFSQESGAVFTLESVVELLNSLHLRGWKDQVVEARQSKDLNFLTLSLTDAMTGARYNWKLLDYVVLEGSKE